MVNFGDWITRKYIDWRGDAIGHEGTVSAFSEWVGVKPSLMSQWMSGTKTPTSVKSINTLTGRFGSEVYDVLGIAPAADVDIEDASIHEVVEIMRAVPPEKRREIAFSVRAMAVISGHKVVKSEGRSDDQTKVD